MARGMEAPECLFCRNHKRYGQDNFARPEDVHICQKHKVIIPWQPGMYYVCAEFDGVGIAVASNCKVAGNLQPDTLYAFPDAYTQPSAVGKFPELAKVPG